MIAALVVVLAVVGTLLRQSEAARQESEAARQQTEIARREAVAEAL